MKRAAATLMCLGLCAAAGATSLLGIRYPLGVPYRPNSGASLAMGGTGTGVVSDQNLMLHNPANLGALRKTALSTLLLLDIANINDSRSGAHSTHARFVPRQISFGFFLGAAGSIAASYEKREDAQLRFEFAGKPYDDEFSTFDSYQQSFIRDGGLSTWQVGWGYAIGKWARVGLSYGRVNCRLTDSRRVTLTGDFTTVSVDSAVVDFRGNMLRAGVLVPVWHLAVGLAAEYPFEGEATHRQGYYVGSPPVDMTAERFTLQLPPQLSGGVSWQISPSWLAAFDLKTTFWSKYDSEDMLLCAPLRSRAVGVSLGGKYVPAPDVLTPKYWETISYCGGVRFDQMPASDAYEYGLSLGVGLPFPAGGGVVDLTLEYSRRQDLNYSRYAEEIVRVGIGINGGRKWRKSSEGLY